MFVSAQEGYRLWSATYDRDPNPLLALDRRVIGERLGRLSGRCFLDVATGTGYWLNYARSQGAHALGIDLSPEMLSEAARNLGSGCLVRADMTALPLKDSFADLAVCSLALGYVPSVSHLFRELARVSRSVIVSDLHECAVLADWRRGFEVDGRRYVIHQFAHTAAELDEAAKAAGLRIEWRLTSHLGEPEREIFVRSGRDSAFAAASRIPALLTTCWTRS